MHGGSRHPQGHAYQPAHNDAREPYLFDDQLLGAGEVGELGAEGRQDDPGDVAQGDAHRPHGHGEQGGRCHQGQKQQRSYS